MKLQNRQNITADIEAASDSKMIASNIFSKDYVDFLNEAGWRLEKKLPSNTNQYSDLLEDTDWKTSDTKLNCSRHYRRDLDALS